jgi:hypothetical protein
MNDKELKKQLQTAIRKHVHIPATTVLQTNEDQPDA